MNDLTFCIPYYGKEQHHTNLLILCIQQIRKFYPTHRILVCKTTDSHIPPHLPSNIEIFHTFVDGSHVIGAIELLIRECKTTHFLLCHDSMFMMKALPDQTNIPYYSLWHFFDCREDFPVMRCVLNDSLITEHNHIEHMYQHQYNILWAGIFGPAFGGTMAMLQEFWKTLHISADNIQPYLGRNGLMMCERYFPLVLAHLGYNTLSSLNGSIFNQPGCFEVTEIPNLDSMEYKNFFYKIWQRR